MKVKKVKDRKKSYFLNLKMIQKLIIKFSLIKYGRNNNN